MSIIRHLIKRIPIKLLKYSKKKEDLEKFVLEENRKDNDTLSYMNNENDIGYDLNQI